MSRATDLQGKIAPLQAQLAEAKTTLGPSNPQLQTLQTQLGVLQSQYNQLLSTASKLPQEQQQLVQLQSNAALAQNLYQAVLGQLQTLQIAEAGSVGDVVIVDPATVPRFPVLPRYGRGMLITILFGLILSVGAAFGVRALRKGIEDPEVLDSTLNLPVYAVIPHSSRQQHVLKKGGQPDGGAPLLLSAQEVNDPALEGLRSLRTAIQVVLPRTGPRVICVSSLGPGEGKSFISANLAYLFAQSGLNVLLIDADMRRGHINKLFRHPRGRGLSELLEGVYSFDDVVRQTPVEKLHFISTGEIPEDAANALANADLESLIDGASTRYDLVIIDVPPVLAVSDAYLITRHASLNLLLLKYGMHSERQVRLVKRQFERHGIRLHGSILNDVSAASQRYAYHKYGYTYQYDYKGGQ
jgi:tyrosine-protein kinase Etk/Wzc